MHEIFTTLSSSRFLNQEEAIDRLRTCAWLAKSKCNEMIAVHLFGSFASGRATPRSNADAVIEVGDVHVRNKERIRDRAQAISLDTPVPVELFVRTTSELSDETGIAGVVAKNGVQLAQPHGIEQHS